MFVLKFSVIILSNSKIYWKKAGTDKFEVIVISKQYVGSIKKG